MEPPFRVRSLPHLTALEANIMTDEYVTVDFQNLVHCTHWKEAQQINDGQHEVSFKPNAVSAHHELLAHTLGELDLHVIWFGITPEFEYKPPFQGEHHPAFAKGSRYGPFSFGININTVLQRYQEHYQVYMEDLFFYLVAEHDAYPRERSDIIVVSAIPLAGLQEFVPNQAPCIRRENRYDEPSWQWICPRFDAYQNGDTNEYFNLEFAFVMAIGADGEYPALNFTVAKVPGAECHLTANSHQTASFCIPFLKRWDKDRKELSVIIDEHPGRPPTVRRRSYDEALEYFGMDQFAGWPRICEVISNEGGCNNPLKHSNHIHHSHHYGLQTQEFAIRKIHQIFA